MVRTYDLRQLPLKSLSLNPVATLKRKMWQWQTALPRSQRAHDCLMAAPSRASASRRSASAISERPAATCAVISGSGTAWAARSLRRSGACRNRSPPTARQPKNRFTRSRTTSERCWISIAIGPSTRSTSTPGSGVWRSNGRGHWIFSGSEWAAISAPTISVQRVTSSVEAKPCLANASPSVLCRRSASGRGYDLPGLFTLRGSATSFVMTVAAGMARRKRARQRAGPRDAELLVWYDRHRRKLPWRALPGETPDPYRIWLSEIMLQQTTVRAVGPYFARFTARWSDVRALAAAPLDDVLKLWAGLGYYARARNLHACAKAVVERHGGEFPGTEEALRVLPGIGAYTAAAIAAIAFDKRASPVDGNIERVIARLFAVEEALPAGKRRIRAFAEGLTPPRRAGDFAQAMMDLGATLCTPGKPACALCPWMDHCAARA